MKVVILTAIPEEFDAVQEHITDRQKEVHPHGTVYRCGRFDEGVGWDVALAQIGAGNARAAAEAIRACEYFRPVDVLMFIGVAGGVKDVGIGDVVIADRIYGYEGGKDTNDGFLPRPQSGEPSYRLVQCAREVATDKVWSNRISDKPHRSPTAFVKPIASGEKVISSLDSATALFIRQFFSDAVAVEMEGVGILEATHQAEVQAVVIRGISDLVDDKAKSDAAGMQRLASVHAAAFAFELLAALQFAGGPDGTPHPPPGPWKLPPGVDDYLVALRKRDSGASDNLRDLLTNNAPSASLIRDLVHAPPRWMTSKSAFGWAAVTVYALAHEEPDSAGDAALRAVDAGVPHSSRWLAWAAIARLQAGRHEDVSSLRERLESSKEDDFVAGVLAALNNDAPTLVSLEPRRNDLAVGERLLLDAYLVKALAIVGRDDAALSLSERLIAEFPDRASARSARAQILAARAASGRAADRIRDFAEARKLALEARDLIRSWGGDSSGTVVLAAQIALDEGDAPLAVRLTRPAPLGEAIDAEASSRRVLEIAGKAAMAAGNKRVLEEVLAETEDDYGRAVLEAEIATRNDDPSKVVQAAFRRAFSHATTREDRFYCLYRIAGTGAWPIAGIEEFQEAPGLDAEEITARSEVARGRTDDAIKRLRPLRQSRLSSARDLARAYAIDGDVDAALQTLADAAERFTDPLLLVDALDTAVNAGKADNIETIGTKLLAVLPASSFARRHTHWRLVELFAKRADWVRMEAHARALLESGDVSPLARWALVVSLFSQNRRRDAWRVLAEAPILEPLDEFQGRIKIELVAENDGSAEAVQSILDLAERFSESEEFAAAALMAVYHIQPARDLGEAILQRLQGNLQQFFTRFPDSTILKKIEFSSPEEMVAKLTSVMQARSGVDLEAPLREVAAGRLPYGLLSSITGRPYAQTLADRSAGWLVANGINQSLEAVERDAVTAALDDAVVLDTSALMILSLQQDLWQTVLAHFKKVVITDLGGFDLARATAASKLNTTGFLELTGEGRLAMREVGADEVRQVAQRLQWMSEAAEGLGQVPIRTLDLFPSADINIQGPWLGSITAAKQKGWCLYADDVALRMAATDTGIRAFGTVGLLKVMVDRNIVGSDVMISMRREMASNLVGDVPGLAELLPELGAQLGWDDRRLIAGAARPSVWADRLAATRMFVQLFQQVGRDRPDVLPLWLYAAATSGQAVLGEPVATNYRASILLNAISNVLSPREHVRPLVEAARQAAREGGGDDPLPLAIDQLHTAALGQMAPADAARYVIELFGGLEAPDRQIAMRIVLAAS